MNGIITCICEALKEEADAIIDYTKKIETCSDLENGTQTAQRFEEIRLDEASHVQQLVLQLTNVLTAGVQPAEKEEE